MDLSTKAVADTSTFQVRDASGDPLFDVREGQPVPLKITVYGPGSKQHRIASTARSNRALERMQKKGGKLRVTAEQEREDRIDFLTAITVRMENITHKSAPGESGELLHRAVYADDGIGYIADQVKEHVGDWENFLAPSPTN